MKRVILISGVILMSGCSSGPPAPTCDRAGLPTGRIDPASLLLDVQRLASPEMEGRGAGSAGSRVAQAYLAERLEAIGATHLEGFGWRLPFAALLGEAGRYDGVNLVGVVGGTGSTDRWIILSAHYDHLGKNGEDIYFGADDNASGVAAVLAIGQRLVAEPLNHNVLLTFFDGEERDLSGSRAFVAAKPLAFDRVALNVNLDMVSRGDDGNLWVTRSPQTRGWPGLDAVAATAPICLQFGHDGTDEGRDNWTVQGDHYHLFRAGIPFVYFGVEDHPDYHKPTDTADKINGAWFAAAVETIEDALRALDADLLAEFLADSPSEGAGAGAPEP